MVEKRRSLTKCKAVKVSSGPASKSQTVADRQVAINFGKKELSYVPA